MRKKAYASWQGSMEHGAGRVSTEGPGLARAGYCRGSRFGHEPGSSPEEMVAAAYASCMAMFTAQELQLLGRHPEAIMVSASVMMEKVEGAWSATQVCLEVKAQAAALTANELQAAAEAARAKCPMSRLINAEATLHCKVESDWRFVAALSA